MEDHDGTSTSSGRGYEVEPTGSDQVDRVLAEVADLGDRPVEEHVAVFERAHEQLRRALDASPGTSAMPSALRPDLTPSDEQGA